MLLKSQRRHFDNIIFSLLKKLWRKELSLFLLREISRPKHLENVYTLYLLERITLRPGEHKSINMKVCVMLQQKNWGNLYLITITYKWKTSSRKMCKYFKRIKNNKFKSTISLTMEYTTWTIKKTDKVFRFRKRDLVEKTEINRNLKIEINQLPLTPNSVLHNKKIVNYFSLNTSL